MTEFKLTPKQEEAQRIIAGDATHVMLEGGSRSGKTFLHVRNIVMRALKAKGSRHAVFRFRFNHVINSIVEDTLPGVMRKAFEGVDYDVNKSQWFMRLPNDAQIWFGGLDDKDRTEKILGQEFVTIYANECSQIPYGSILTSRTRLAQKVMQQIDGVDVGYLKPRYFYDCNPPTNGHWTYRVFHQGLDPETKTPLPNTSDYAWFRMNPEDNRANLSESYLNELGGLPERLKRRFLYGEYTDDNPNALFSQATIDKWRHSGQLPDMVRVIVGVDPSGSGDEDNADNDEIGIVVCGLGTDGNAYVLEDASVKAGPKTWGTVATSAYDRQRADLIVGEKNFGGAMVEYVIQTCRPRTPYKEVTSSRGKVVRAEPFSSLYEQGKIRHVGNFEKLEDELMSFSTMGFVGSGSPNRADALVFALTELFPGMVRGETAAKAAKPARSSGWLGS